MMEDANDIKISRIGLQKVADFLPYPFIIAEDFGDEHLNTYLNEKFLEEISEGLEVLSMGDVEIKSRAYCSAFNFKGAQQQKKVGQLSGGERNRVHLAKMLKSGANVILLDEPSNDLDVDTLRALEDAILDFPGCVFVISHDRWFLDRICTHILAFEGNSDVYYFEGGFSDYEENKKKRLGGDLTPKRLKYRKLIRN